MKKGHLIILGLAILLILPASVPAYSWDRIVAFGDSLSDNGPGDGYGIGVATNGPVWLDYLAASMEGVELEDRALCGARSDGPLINNDTVNIGLIQQVSDYADTLLAGADLSHTLFTIWIGGNDFLAFGPYEEVIDNAINNISDALQDLIDAGARDILVMNLPDLGLAPGVIYNPEADANAFTSASMTFNTSLSQLVCDFRGAYPKVKFYMADTFKLLQYAVKYSESLGFTNVDGMCGLGGALPECAGYIFFDSIHPTTVTHQYLAALAVAQIKHGPVSRELKDALQKLNPIQPRMPFVVQCKD